MVRARRGQLLEVVVWYIRSDSDLRKVVRIRERKWETWLGYYHRELGSDRYEKTTMKKTRKRKMRRKR